MLYVLLKADSPIHSHYPHIAKVWTPRIKFAYRDFLNMLKKVLKILNTNQRFFSLHEKTSIRYNRYLVIYVFMMQNAYRFVCKDLVPEFVPVALNFSWVAYGCQKIFSHGDLTLNKRQQL